MSDLLLVTGAAGHLGQRVIHHLLDTLKVPASRIIATSRKPDSLSALAERGVIVRAADFADAASLAGTFAGANRMLLISTDAIGHRLPQHRNAIAAAVEAGVSHVVYTSMPAPEGSPVLFAPEHAGTEAALASSSLPGWTVLRNHWYFENLFMSLPSVLAMGGQWFSAAGDGKLANIARDDLARAAAVVLADNSTGKATYTLSGAEALTTAQQAQAVSQAIGRPIQVIPVPVEALVQGMIGAGIPEAMARIVASFDISTAAGEAGTVTSDFKAITGIEPQSFSRWLDANKAALAA